jgi:hypothetical protein
MLEFEDLVYLDVEKTGSTTVRAFLAKFARSSLVSDHKHRPVREKNPDKIYVISCRHPLDQYTSLYKYGASGLGAVRGAFEKNGMGGLYDYKGAGFPEWLSIVLDPVKSRNFLSRKNRLKDYHPSVEFFGPQTLRFLTLDFPRPIKILDSIHSKEDVISSYKKYSAHDVLLRTETLTADLISLLHGPHASLFADVKAAEEYLLSQPAKNVSGDEHSHTGGPPADILQTLQEREWFFFEILGYKPYFVAESAKLPPTSVNHAPVKSIQRRPPAGQTPAPW